MGQYFTPIFLNSTATIVHALDPTDYGSGRKLAGHTRADTRLMYAVQALLALDGGLRLVWAGDYGDPQPGRGANFYRLTEPEHLRRFEGLVLDDVEPNATLAASVTPRAFGYVCNPSKRQYIENLTLPVDDTGWRRTPLPWLTADGGPYSGADRVSTWASDRIYYSRHPPGAGWTVVNDPTQHRTAGHR